MYVHVHVCHVVSLFAEGEFATVIMPRNRLNSTTLDEQVEYIEEQLSVLESQCKGCKYITSSFESCLLCPFSCSQVARETAQEGDVCVEETDKDEGQTQ